jgi:hypothetical protein
VEVVEVVVEVVEVVVESGGGGGGVVESGGGGGGGAVVEPYCEEVHRGSTTSERHHRRWGGYLRGGPQGSTDSTEGFTTGSPHREGGERVCRWGEPPGRSSGRGSEGGAE